MRAWYWRWRLAGREPPACLGCGGALSERTIPVAIARTAAFEVQVRRVPYRGCAEGCGDRRVATPRFPEAVLAAVMAGAVPVAQPQPSGGWRCVRCSSREWSPVRRLANVQGDVALDGLAAFTVSLTGPTSSCGSCGTVQIRGTPAAAREISLALQEAWRAAGLRLAFR